MQSSFATAATTYSGELQRHGQSIQNSFTSGLDRHNRSKRARIESTDIMVGDIQSDLRHFQRGIASTSRNIETFVGRVVSEVKYLPARRDTAELSFNCFRATRCGALQKLIRRR